MKKYILLVFIVSFLLNCATTQSKANMGYDLVFWGSSAAKVRNVYNIGQEIQPTYSQNEPNIIKLIQENISDSIKNRTFLFVEDKLVQVSLLYNDDSDDNVRNLQTELENKFGDITGYDESLIDNHRLYIKTFVFGQYYPELIVLLVHAIDRKTTVADGLAVVYIWGKDIDINIFSNKLE